MNEDPQLRKHLGLIKWFSENSVAANILMMFFVIGGLFTLSKMRTETFPSIDPRLITINVSYPGATPYEVADSITRRAEEALLGIEGVKRINSTASEGSGQVRVELKDFANADDVYNDVETAINSLNDFPPEEAEKPIITKARVTPNVLSLAIHGDASEKTLKYWAETIEDELRQLPGVALTDLRGIPNYEISIEISEHTLRQYGLTLKNIADAISQFSIDTPAGQIESGRGDILLRVQEKKYTGPEFENIVIRTLEDGSTLKLGDIAQIIDGFEDVNLISRFNGERAAFIDIKRSESEDTLLVANAVKTYLKTLQLPKGLTLSLQQDQTINLHERISMMMRNAILGFCLVFLLLLLFLDLKLAFWISVAIPVSFLGGLMIVNALGYSINMISLFALIVVLGIVVDDAIVTGESIFHEQEKDPSPASLLRGVTKVFPPVTVGVLTTLIAFTPLVFSTGTMGQIIQAIPVVVISILIVSLLEAYLVLPSHLAHPGRWSHGVVARLRSFCDHCLQRCLQNIILPIARRAICWRYLTVTIFICFALFTASLVSSGLVRFVFFPRVEGDQISITLTHPQGTPFSTTKKTLLAIESQIKKVDHQLLEKYPSSYFESISLSIGSSSSGNSPVRGSNSSQGSNLGQVKIQLIPSSHRKLSSLEIESLIKARVQNFPNIETLEFQSSPIGSEADIEVEISHFNENVLNDASEELKNRLAQIPGNIEITDSFEPGKIEYLFKLNDEGLAVGLTPAELGRQLRAAYFGLEAQRFVRGRSEVIVYVRYPKQEREDLSSLSSMRIHLSDGRQVPLSSVAEVKEQTGYSQIQTVDGRRIVRVSCDVDLKITTPTEMIKVIEKQIMPTLQEIHPGLSYSFEGKSRNQREDLASLIGNMQIGLLFIYVLLGSYLRSYLYPLIIMSAIPFGIIGAIWGHILLGYDLTFISLFGVVALAGVVVNDTVVLIDYLMHEKREGSSLYDSTLYAIERRFRPILLTTLTTCLGLLPMLLEKSMQARFLVPMVISLSGGISFATLITLILVPSLILIVNDIKKKLFRKSEDVF